MSTSTLLIYAMIIYFETGHAWKTTLRFWKNFVLFWCPQS